MSLEIRTPALVEAVEFARSAANRILTGTIDRGDATVLNTASGRLIGAVSTEIKARLAAPKIAAQEAKLIEQQSRKQVTAAGDGK